jgi:serine/threonine protein kinase
MGAVYRAKDQKLGHDIAIKVLPEEFGKDADRVARFQREAKLLASLNHPNIAAIHGCRGPVCPSQAHGFSRHCFEAYIDTLTCIAGA